MTGQARTSGIAGKIRQQHRGTATARTLALQPYKTAIPEKTNDGGNCTSAIVFLYLLREPLKRPS